MTLVSKERAILFVDVADSTAIYELLGDKPAAKAIDACLQAIAQDVTRWDGTVVKTIGDEIMAAFPGANAACEAAKSMQSTISRMPVSGGVKYAIKIGFHFGQVLEERMDFWGDGVNTAARLAGLARRGQILTSASTAGLLSPVLREHTRDFASLSVKGKQDPVSVVEVLWEDDEEATQIAAPIKRAQVVTTLKLLVADRACEFPAEKAAIWLGRDADCDVVVAEKTASRRHARIERRGSKYVLVDDSTNGTYVCIGDEHEVLLRREQLPLRGSGKISLGVSAQVATASISFDC